MSAVLWFLKKIPGPLLEEPNPTWGYTRFGPYGKRPQITT